MSWDASTRASRRTDVENCLQVTDVRQALAGGRGGTADVSARPTSTPQERGRSD
jgi:hypothetical protein